MGDRANFGFRAKENDPTLFLYLHWGGHRMMANLAAAVAHAFPRWDDEGYATRICISHLVPDHNAETGAGIYIDTIVDNEHSIPVVLWDHQEVWLYDESAVLNGLPKFKIGLGLFIEKYGDKPIKRYFREQGGTAVKKTPDPIVEEPRYTKTEWLGLMSTLF